MKQRTDSSISPERKWQLESSIQASTWRGSSRTTPSRIRTASFRIPVRDRASPFQYMFRDPVSGRDSSARAKQARASRNFPSSQYAMPSRIQADEKPG